MEIYSKELYQALREVGVDAHICKPESPILGRPSVFRVGIFFLSACWTLLRHRKSYDAVLLGDFCIASLAMVARICMPASVRIAVALHGNDLYFMRKRAVLAAAYRWISTLVIASRSLDAAIANSRAIEQEALSRGVRHISVVPLATRLPDLYVSTPLKRRRALLFSGRLIRYKGLSWFVDNVLPSLDPSLELLVAGEVWDESERTCLHSDPRIHYLGPVPYEELAELRAQVAACIMPNIPPAATEQDEGFGLAALESPAAGTPIIAAACGGLPDAVAHGTTGFLLPPLDATAWIHCVNHVLTWTPDQYAHFAHTARAHIAEHYNWHLVAQRTIAALVGHS
jgi:glycosyltransferase involved in cell wall biosynthesis